MDAISVKSEEGGGCGRRRVTALEGDGSKCIKRRRRDPALAAAAVVEDGSAEKQRDASAAAAAVAPSTTTKRSSRFRGVSRHRWTGRFEAHLWDKGSWNATQKKKGKQVYLGAYDEEESAARAYDLAALKYWGPTTFTNFPVSDYENELQIMQNVAKEEYLASLRRKSSGFSRGVSKYRGVARHHHNGRWEARIGRVFGNKYLYLGTYSTQEEAAAAYDVAAIEYRGINAVTNFDLSTYIRWLRPGAANILALQHPIPRSDTPPLPAAAAALALEDSDASFRFTPFLSDDLCSPQKPPPKSSSPTALSLLLRSSVFKELVEKNSTAAKNEAEGQAGKEEDFPGVFYDGIADVPFVCSGSGDGLPEMELPEEGGALYYDRHEQSLWSSVLSMTAMD